MSENNKPEILDLDAIKPKERKFKIGGKEIDVTVIPFDVMLDIVDNIDKFKLITANLEEPDKLSAGDLKDIRELLQLLFDTTVKVCSNSNKAINKEWLQKNVDMTQMIKLLAFIIGPLMEKVADSKNLLAVELGGGQ